MPEYVAAARKSMGAEAAAEFEKMLWLAGGSVAWRQRSASANSAMRGTS